MDADAADQPPADATDLAVVQFAPHIDIDANLAALTGQVRTAADQGARMVVAPEYSMFALGRLDERLRAAAQPLDGPFVAALGELAAATGVHLVAGMVETTEPDDGRIYNTLVVLGPDGALRTHYRKVHLYDAFGQRESEVVRPGPLTDPPLFTAEGLTFGLQTCFDLRFPEGFRRLAAAGAQVLLLPAQWIPGPGKVDQWTTLLRARAIENTVYLAAADQCGPRGAGSSMIIDPAGRVLQELADEPGMALARLEPDLLEQVRRKNPSLALRRFTVGAPETSSVGG
ncbi:carbon-nitrogen hydrolase family protein [Nocardia sp. NPDC051750]|uniref:carbon-nitrogen hydrolase family protein n=1 Tax=Nocardia sp. NPDC051750 TaxID=3364325 RepID=UPI0037964F95